jgi:hypothetical protein
MASVIAVVEHHCVQDKRVVPEREKVICIINQSPKEAFYDKENLMNIAKLTNSFNAQVLNNVQPLYTISFKEVKENDDEVFQNLCNDVLTGKEPVLTVNNLKEFSNWYKNYLNGDVRGKIEKESRMLNYVKAYCKK